MLRYLTRLFHKKGFTLTELIIVIAIIGILMLSLVTFSAPVRLMISGTDAKAETLTISNTIGNYLEHTLAYANDIRIYAGVDLSGSDATLNAINKKYGEMAKSGGRNTDPHNRSGMLVFSFEEKDDPMMNGHRIYELIYSDPDGTMLSYGNEKDPDSKLTVRKINNHKQLYLADFYGKYSFFLKSDSASQLNNAKGKQYLKMTINSYYFDGSETDADGSSVHFTRDAAISHYKTPTMDYVEGFAPTTNDAGETVQSSGYKAEFVGQEEVFFCLENSAADGFNCDYHVGYTDESGVTTYGPDVVILYNILTYDFTPSS